MERDKVFGSLTVAEHFRLVGASDADRKQYEEIFPALATRAKWLLDAGPSDYLLAMSVASTSLP